MLYIIIKCNVKIGNDKKMKIINYIYCYKKINCISYVFLIMYQNNKIILYKIYTYINNNLIAR